MIMGRAKIKRAYSSRSFRRAVIPCLRRGGEGTASAFGVGAAAAALMLLPDALCPNRKVKLPEIGTTLLFASLTLYALVDDVQWSIAAVRLKVDVGLALVVLASIPLRQPFALQYVRKPVSHDQWGTSRFLRVNYVISTAWAVEFAILAFADVLMAYVPTNGVRSRGNPGRDRPDQLELSASRRFTWGRCVCRPHRKQLTSSRGTAAEPPHGGQTAKLTDARGQLRSFFT